MKKQFLFAVAVTMLTACVNTDNLRDISPYQDSENDGSISFNPFTEKVTKGTNAAENSTAYYSWLFYDIHNNFKVWGYKSTAANNPVFEGTTVTVEKPSAGVYTYTYSPLRFWDKTAASYQFFAAAPADDSWTFNYTGADATTYGTGSFQTTSTLTGVNLMNQAEAGPSADLRNYFKGTADVDKLIAAPCQVAQTSYNAPTPAAVHLNFIHILSKLNVTIKKADKLASDDYKVILKEFKICNVPGTGYFNEASADADHTAKNTRWNFVTPTFTSESNLMTEGDNSYNHNKKIEYKALTNWTNPAAETDENLGNHEIYVTTSANYILESLVVPQNIEYERVALDGAAHEAVPAVTTAVLYSDYEEYTKAKAVEAILSKEAFDKVHDNPTLTSYNDVIAGTDDDISSDAFQILLNEITKTPITPAIEAYLKAENEAYVANSKHSSEPYFIITYSINGDVFTQYFNLAAAFLNYTNNNQMITKTTSGETVTYSYTNLTETDPKTFSFNEGWQNTLNIIINPTAIEFTADVAKWADTPEREYEIERGNN